MIGGAVPDDDQLVLGPFGSEPAQNIDGVLAVGPGIRPEPHLAFVVEIKAVERELVRQTRRGRGNPEAPAALRPAIAEIGILVNVGFVQGDQQMAVMLGSRQEILDLLDKGLPALRIGPAEQLFGFLPGQLQALQGGADRLAAAGPAELLTDPADQTAQGPARRWIGSGYRRGCGGALGASRQGRLRSPSKGGAGALIGQRLGAAGVVEMQPLHHRLRVTARALGNARGAALLSDFIERQKALAGGARSSPADADPPASPRRLNA